MKKIFFIVSIGVLFLLGCTQINQSIIDQTVKQMKFMENGKVVEVQESIKGHCRTTIYEPNEIVLNFVAYSAKTKHAYQDCMARLGYICIDDCDYEVK
jgi:hypothetical protein